MATELTQHNHGARINTSLHRVSVVDESCAEEGGWINSAHGPKRCAAPKKQSADEVAIGWHMALQALGWVILLLAAGAGLAMIFHEPKPGEPPRVIRGQR
jgi:hypothetical protein